MSDLRSEIIEALHVRPQIDPAQTVEEIVAFLERYLVESGARGYVLGISGGQDSCLCGKLAQMAVTRAREATGRDSCFFALRLPCGSQKDEDDAQVALAFIGPDRSAVIDIEAAVNASSEAFRAGVGEPLEDYHRGNVKARERMIAQYAVAGQHGLLVLGTDHAAEAVTGFFTKFGDGACDLAPLTGLTKRQGRALLQHLGAPTRLTEKAPTADLEDLKPQLPDEEALGLTYQQIDDYLEGEAVEGAVAERLESLYLSSRHKRAQPVSRFD